MKQTFFNLDKSRQLEIEHIVMGEFGEKGYDKASINSIIEKLSIAKGSFYNYTKSKEQLYLYHVKKVYQDIINIQGNPDTYKTTDLFDRIGEIVTAIIEYCRRDQIKSMFLLKIEEDYTSSIYPKVLKVRDEMNETTLPVLFGNIDWSLYKLTHEEILRIYSWFSDGVRKKLNTNHFQSMSIDNIKRDIFSDLELYKKALTAGIYR